VVPKLELFLGNATKPSFPKSVVAFRVLIPNFVLFLNQRNDCPPPLKFTV
jgi:hypothetical protein